MRAMDWWVLGTVVLGGCGDIVVDDGWGDGGDDGWDDGGSTDTGGGSGGDGDTGDGGTDTGDERQTAADNALIIVVPPGTPEGEDASEAVEAFTWATFSWFVTPDTETMHLSLTDRTGITACSLSEDPRYTPGREASQVFAAVPIDEAIGCPDGLFSLDPSGCEVDDVVGCATFRRFDGDGALDAFSVANGGAVKVDTLGGGQCSVEVEVFYPGGVTVEASVQLDSPSVLDPEAECVEAE